MSNSEYIELMARIAHWDMALDRHVERLQDARRQVAEIVARFNTDGRVTQRNEPFTIEEQANIRQLARLAFISRHLLPCSNWFYNGKPGDAELDRLFAG